MLGYRLNKLGAAMRGNRPLMALRFDDPTRALDSRITFTRASSATYFDSTGTLQTAGSGVARAHAFQDYNPSTLAPLGFLIEEQRTNLLLRSEEFDNASWGKTNATVTANSVTSPDATVDADTLTITGAGGAINQTTGAFSAGSTITVTIFAKKNTSNFIRFELGNLVNCWFNLNTGATASNSAGSGNVLFSAKSIQAINNGWYRCCVTVTTSVITTLGILIFATDSDSNTSSINSSVYLWGAQAEVGSFPTSYIATTAAAATRLADSASITGTNFSSFYNQSEGTLLVNAASFDNTSAAGNNRALAVDDNGTNNYMSIAYGGAGQQVRCVVVAGGITQSNPITNAWAVNTFKKVASAYKSNDFAACLGGGTVATDAAGTIPTVDRMRIGNLAGGNYWNGWVSSIAYYRTRLPNTTLQALTA